MNRKIFLKSVTLSIASCIFLVSGCNDDVSKTQTGLTPPEPSMNDSGAATETTNESSIDCNDVSDLSKTDLTPRIALEYVPVSVEPEKFCSNCRFFKPAKQPNDCGGCQLFKGKVNTMGYCKSWFTKG